MCVPLQNVCIWTTLTPSCLTLSLHRLARTALGLPPGPARGACGPAADLLTETGHEARNPDSVSSGHEERERTVKSLWKRCVM